MTYEQETILTQRLGIVLQKLQAERAAGKEALWSLGAMAAKLLDDAKAGNWAALKRKLDDKNHDSLILSAQRQGQELLDSGRHKPAIAVEALVTSVIASRFGTAEIKAGEALLDEMIETTIKAYRKARAAAN